MGGGESPILEGFVITRTGASGFPGVVMSGDSGSGHVTTEDGGISLPLDERDRVDCKERNRLFRICEKRQSKQIRKQRKQVEQIALPLLEKVPFSLVWSCFLSSSTFLCGVFLCLSRDLLLFVFFCSDLKRFLTLFLI